MRFIRVNEAIDKYGVDRKILLALKRLGFVVFHGFKYVDEDGLSLIVENEAIMGAIREVLESKPYVYYDPKRFRSLFKKAMLRREGLVGTGELARMFGRSFQWANNVARRKLNSVRIGKRRFIKVDEVFFDFVDKEMMKR